METILNVQHVSKTYQGAGQTLTVLDNINFTVATGSTVSIVGPSGSGKTTLLGLCAGLDRASNGIIELNNIRLDELSEGLPALPALPADFSRADLYDDHN